MELQQHLLLIVFATTVTAGSIKVKTTMKVRFVLLGVHALLVKRGQYLPPLPTEYVVIVLLGNIKAKMAPFLQRALLGVRAPPESLWSQTQQPPYLLIAPVISVQLVNSKLVVPSLALLAHTAKQDDLLWVQLLRVIIVQRVCSKTRVVSHPLRASFVQLVTNTWVQPQAVRSVQQVSSKIRVQHWLLPVKTVQQQSTRTKKGKVVAYKTYAPATQTLRLKQRGLTALHMVTIFVLAVQLEKRRFLQEIVRNVLPVLQPLRSLSRVLPAELVDTKIKMAKEPSTAVNLASPASTAIKRNKLPFRHANRALLGGGRLLLGLV
jgi:hypothetical protein